MKVDKMCLRTGGYWKNSPDESEVTQVPSVAANCPMSRGGKDTTPATFSICKTVLNLWKHIKEFDLCAIGENIVKNCVCCDDIFCRTQYPVYIVLARTILLRYLIRPLYKFLGRSKGRRRSRRVGSPFFSSGGPYRMSPPSPFATILLVCSALIGFAEACSSRNTPKPRPPPASARPNITFPTYTCPPSYAAWYCLNGATCFTLRIDENLLYNCECAEGFMGQRCEFKDLDGSYLPSRQRVLLETASIAGGATIAVFLVVIVCITLYLHYQRKTKERKLADIDGTDGPGRDLERRPFSRCLSIPMDRLGETDKGTSEFGSKGPEYWKRFSKFSSYVYRNDERKMPTNLLMGHNSPCGDFSVNQNIDRTHKPTAVIRSSREVDHTPP